MLTIILTIAILLTITWIAQVAVAAIEKILSR